jgi:16S rRNA (guanine1516-N2)-methyltransferase
MSFEQVQDQRSVDWDAGCRPPRVGVCAEENNGSLMDRAKHLAQEAGLSIVRSDASECDLLLMVTSDGLELRESGRRAAGGIRVDFRDTGPDARRVATASRRQPLALAVGMKHSTPSVVDATAGLGRDAIWLASLGCRVTAIERSVVLGLMFRDALSRASEPPAVSAIADGRLKLMVGDSRELLTAMTGSDAPDVVYLDPMFPTKRGSALPKKEMRICRRLVGTDPDAGELLEVARQVARKRVVVKRSPRSAPVADSPSMHYGSKLTRYDVYLT